MSGDTKGRKIYVQAILLTKVDQKPDTNIICKPGMRNYY